MNGQELFEQLGRMTEEQRKTSQYWQIADKSDFIKAFEDVADSLEEWAGNHIDKPSRMTKALKEIKKGITADEIAYIARSTQNIEGWCEDSYMDGFIDTYKEQLFKLLQVKLIAYGIVTASQEELAEEQKRYESEMSANEDWRRHMALGTNY